MDGHAETLIDLDAIKGNVTALREHVGAAAVMAVVKSDAYGHGMVPAARAALAGAGLAAAGLAGADPAGGEAGSPIAAGDVISALPGAIRGVRAWLD